MATELLLVFASCLDAGSISGLCSLVMLIKCYFGWYTRANAHSVFVIFVISMIIVFILFKHTKTPAWINWQTLRTVVAIWLQLDGH